MPVKDEEQSKKINVRGQKLKLVIKPNITFNKDLFLTNFETRHLFNPVNEYIECEGTCECENGESINNPTGSSMFITGGPYNNKVMTNTNESINKKSFGT